MKITTELELIGDRVVNICEVLASGDAHDPLPSYAGTLQIGNLATAMVRGAMGAFSRSDISLVKPVLEKDKEFDALYCHVFPNLITGGEGPRANSPRRETGPIVKGPERNIRSRSQHRAVVMFLVSGKGMIHFDIHERRARTDWPQQRNGHGTFAN
jgi:phosphate uptake regulator